MARHRLAATHSAASTKAAVRAGGKQADVRLHPGRNAGTGLRPAAQTGEPGLPCLDRDAEPDAGGDEQDREDDELGLALEGVERSQGQRELAAGAGGGKHEILEAADRVATDAEAGEAAFQPGTVGAGVGVHRAAGGLVEHGLDEARAARAGVVQGAPLASRDADGSRRACRWLHAARRAGRAPGGRSRGRGRDRGRATRRARPQPAPQPDRPKGSRRPTRRHGRATRRAIPTRFPHPWPGRAPAPACVRGRSSCRCPEHRARRPDQRCAGAAMQGELGQPGEGRLEAERIDRLLVRPEKGGCGRWRRRHDRRLRRRMFDRRRRVPGGRRHRRLGTTPRCDGSDQITKADVRHGRSSFDVRRPDRGAAPQQRHRGM